MNESLPLPTYVGLECAATLLGVQAQDVLSSAVDRRFSVFIVRPRPERVAAARVTEDGFCEREGEAWDFPGGLVRLFPEDVWPLVGSAGFAMVHRYWLQDDRPVLIDELCPPGTRPLGKRVHREDLQFMSAELTAYQAEKGEAAQAGRSSDDSKPEDTPQQRKEMKNMQRLVALLAVAFARQAQGQGFPIDDDLQFYRDGRLSAHAIGQYVERWALDLAREDEPLPGTKAGTVANKILRGIESLEPHIREDRDLRGSDDE